MRASPDIGHIRVVYINGNPLLVRTIDDYFPIQEINPVTLIQGGPRTLVYDINKKVYHTKLSVPVYLNVDGEVAEPIKEIIRYADNPTLGDLSIGANFSVMDPNITARPYNHPYRTSEHKRLTLGCAAIPKLKITTREKGLVTIDFEVIGLPDLKNENDYDFAMDTDGLMSRYCSFADCLVTVKEGSEKIFKEDITELSLEFNNKLEPLYLLAPDSQDTASLYYLMETVVTGEWQSIKRVTDWDNERLTWKHGGHAMDEYIKIRIADMLATIRDCVYHPRTQPLGVGILKQVDQFLAVWRSGYLSQTKNLVFEGL